MAMKRFFLIFGTLLAFSTKSQTCQGPPILNENFDAGIPGNWTILNFDSCTMFFNMPLKGYTGAWQAYEHYGRKGIADCGRFTTNCTSNDYLITPQITLGSAPVCLSWKGSSMYLGFIENYEIRISTTTPDSIGMKAHPALAVINNDVPAWTDHSVDLSAYAGQTVYIGFWYNTTNQYAIYLDDIRVSEPVNLDATVTSVNFQDVLLPASQVISGQLLNGGLNTITSFNLNWKVGAGPVNTMIVSSVNVTPSSFYDFSHNINWTPTVNGTYQLKIWASNLNGTNDMYPANDTLTKIVFVNTVQRKVLVEEFTQASCPPCASQNPGFDSIVQPNITSGKISSIKYHTVWPGVDPMNVYDKGEVAERVLYYGVGGVPTGLIDGFYLSDCGSGSTTGSPMCMTQNNLDSVSLIPSIFNINITESKTSTVYNVTVTVTAKTDVPFTSFSLYSVIMEDTVVYSSPPGTNGEYIFNQVARKMFPDSLGDPLMPMSNNQSYSTSYSYTPDLSTCQMSELHTVAFVSDDATRHVYQSENTSRQANGVQNINQLSVAKVYPNPFTDIVTVYFNQHLTNYNCIIYDVFGRQVLLKNLQAESGKNNFKLDLSTLSKGTYLLTLENTESGKKTTTRIVK
jgi:hypothetical protein